MKSVSLTVFALVCAVLLPNCAPMPSSYVNSQRGQSSMLTSDAQLRQNRTQRSNEIEEARHQNDMRNESYLGPLNTLNRGIGQAHGIVGGIQAFERY